MIEGSYHSWDLYTTGQLVDGLQQKKKKEKENRFSLNGNGIMSSFLGRQFYRSTLYFPNAYVDITFSRWDVAPEFGTSPGGCKMTAVLSLTSHPSNYPKKTVGYYYGSEDETVSDVFLWTLIHGHTSAGRPAKTFTHRVYAGECLEDLPNPFSKTIIIMLIASPTIASAQSVATAIIFSAVGTTTRGQLWELSR